MPADNTPGTGKELAPGKQPMPKPTPGNPRLFDVKVYPSWLRTGIHLDMEARFPDYVFPEGATVKFYWEIPNGKAPKGESLAATLWCQAGPCTTPWRNGHPNLNDLHCNDPYADASRVRLEALHALYALYAKAEEAHGRIIWEAHEAAAQDLNTKLEERTKHMPDLSEQDAGDFLRDPAWWPDRGVEHAREWGYRG